MKFPYQSEIQLENAGQFPARADCRQRLREFYFNRHPGRPPCSGWKFKPCLSPCHCLLYQKDRTPNRVIQIPVQGQLRILTNHVIIKRVFLFAFSVFVFWG